MKNMTIDRRKFLSTTAFSLAGLTIIPGAVFGGKGRISPSDKINLAFIGTGKQSEGLVNNFIKRNEVRIVAGSDVDKNKLERFKKQVETYYEENGEAKAEVKTYEDFRDLLERKDIDAVIVATPDHWHALQSIEAMKAGMDVYCEKPLAHTIEEGKAMVTAAEKYNRIVQTGSMQRSWGDFRHASELVRNGYIGEIKKILVSVGAPAIPCELPKQTTPHDLNWNLWLGPAPERGYNAVLSPPVDQTHWPRWRDYKEYGGGILADWGAHMFDIAQWGMGTDDTGPVEVIPPNDPKEIFGLSMKYKNGVEVVHEDFGRGHAVRFIGSDGSLDVSRSFLDSKPENIVSAEIKNGETRLYYSDDHYQNWLDSIKSRKQPVADVTVGHRTATICNLANIAYWLNRPFKWDPEKEKITNDNKAQQLVGKTYRDPWTLEI